MNASTASPKKLKVNITYNGTTLPLDYNPHQEAQALYEHALILFHVRGPERDQVGLYLPDNTTEVNYGASIESSGVVAETTLILRPRRAAGGR